METCRGSQSFGMHMSATVVSPRVFFRVCSILNAHEIVHSETPNSLWATDPIYLILTYSISLQQVR